MFRFKQTHDQGFSLLETIMSLTMFAIVLGATGWAVISGLNAQAEAEARDKAVQLGQDAMSIALKVEYDKLGFISDVIDAASVPNGSACYADTLSYTLPAGVEDIMLSGQTQPRVVIPVNSNSSMVPCVNKITDVQDWKRVTAGREYQISTNITAETWTTPGDIRSYAGSDSPTGLPGGAVVTGKRVTIETRWLVTNNRGNCPSVLDVTGQTPELQYSCVYQSFVRSPSANEQVPIGMGFVDGNADACDIVSEIFCRVYATQGNVLAGNPGPTGQYPQAVPVQLFIETRVPVSPSDVSSLFDLPEVDRGKACGSREDGTAIEYGFCGDGSKIPGKSIDIGPQGVDNPEGWHLIAGNDSGFGYSFMAVLSSDKLSPEQQDRSELNGNIRPGVWRVQFIVNGESVIRPYRWSYADDTPLVSRIVNCPVLGGTAPLTFAVDGLSPNSLVYGNSRYGEGFGVSQYDYAGESEGALGVPPNRSALDHMEVIGTNYALVPPEQTPISVTKSGEAKWDTAARTMSQDFKIPASILPQYVNPATGEALFKVRITRAVDGITTTSVFSCAG
jgi:type II secretory pathway pseudopilin PulG